MSASFANILATVGNTPLVRLTRLAPPNVNIYVKIEAFNPMGSVKDRLALGIVEDAERRGLLRPGQTIVEATSGNTGIGLAMVCAVKGYALVVVMAENFSVERRKMMRFLGAKVVLTPAAQKGSGMAAKAAELAAAHGWFLCRQFENEANAEIHTRTTAQEILGAFNQERLDYWVTGYGTGGTLKGVARALKAADPRTSIVVCEPDNSPLLGSGVAQPLAPDGAPSASHPSFRPHLMQGWTPDFISKLTADAIAMKLVDRIVAVRGADALRCARELATKEGIFAGTSGGATLAGALAVAATAEDGANIVCMLPDTGERYLTTPLFDGIGVDMSSEELEISRSTPGARFDVAASSVPAAAVDEAVSAETCALLSSIVDSHESPLVMFALEWCEFCWAVRKLFARCDVAYRSVDLDSAAYQVEDLGGRLRGALRERTGSRTIPQIFVAGRFIGGATEVFDAFKSGELQRELAAAGVAFDHDARVDPYQLLPAWLHPR